MNKEEIKNILIDFICEYDFTSYNNDKVYDKFADIILDKVNKDMPNTIIMASRQNGKSKLVQIQFKKILNDYAIKELQKLLNKGQTIDILHQSGHYINQKKVNVVFKQHIENQIKELKQVEDER